MVPVQVRPQDCLFVPAPAAQPLVKLEGSEEKALKDKLTWEGGRNAYAAGYTSLLEQQPPGEAMMLPPLNREGWKTFTGETTSKFGVELLSPPAADGPFPQLMPGQFKVADELSGFGADEERLSRLLRRGTDARRASAPADGAP